MQRENSLKAPLRHCEHVISVSTSAAQSASTFEPGTYIFVSDQGCHILFGSNPTATTSSQRVPANTMLRITGVANGHKISVIADDNGTAWVRKEP